MTSKVTEKHKLYVLIAMVLMAALIGYFRFSGPPQTGGQPSSVTATYRTETTTDPALLASQPTQERIPIEKRHSRRQILRNIFEPMVPLTAVPQPPPLKEKKTLTEMTLSGTIIGDELSMAIINNQFVRPGQSLGQYKITRITPDKVYLASKEGERCLNVITATEAITE